MKLIRSGSKWERTVRCNVPDGCGSHLLCDEADLLALPSLNTVGGMQLYVRCMECGARIPVNGVAEVVKDRVVERYRGAVQHAADLDAGERT